ncbi:hypothetical protein [Leifsonia poae]|uniref:hypothetical protein n=1 Tax=Leifsonia poae TaxID=110933 RepID=UPI001CBB8F0B|nr:hypothetical protein [Leifsonia poae]
MTNVISVACSVTELDDRLTMSRIFTRKFNPGRARWELVVRPERDVYAFPLTLAIAGRQTLDGHRRYLVGMA